jgi:hypothetical protein
MKKTPAVVTAIAPVPSLKMRGEGNISRHEEFDFRGGKRLLHNARLSTQRTKRTNPTMRMVQAQPTLGTSACTIRGNRTPPNPLPVNANPLAVPRLLSNQWDIAPMAGVKRKEFPIPLRIENASRN